MLPAGCRVLAGGLPALLFSVAINNPCEAIQVSDFASPPPTPINSVPARDAATAEAPTAEPARYMPPVHIVPPSERASDIRNVDGDAEHGHRSSVRQVSYTGRAVVASLNDHSVGMSQSSGRESYVDQSSQTKEESRLSASQRYVGMHGYRTEPTLAVPASNQHARIRKPGLQDHIASAFKRSTGKETTEPQHAVRPAEPTYQEVPIHDAPSRIEVSETASRQLPRRYGSARASRSFKRQWIAASQIRRAPKQIQETDDYDTHLVSHDTTEDRLAVDIKGRFHDQTADWEAEEIALDDAPAEQQEFATDYQRPANPLDAEWASEHVDEEIMPTARMAAAQSMSRTRPPRMRQAARPLTRQSRPQSLSGRQVSVLTRSRQDSDTDPETDFEEVPNRLRSSRQIEKIDDFDPLGDSDDGLEDFGDESEGASDLDELDRDIDAELERLRDRSNDEEDDDDTVSRPPVKDCDTFRRELLDSSIREIALDISPPASSLPGETYPIGRNWTDQSGNVIATGAMQDLRRGYVILDNGQKLAHARLSEADLAAVSEFWRLPTVCSVGNRGSVERCWIPQTFTWTASNVCHKTLFFENVQLERYGHSHGPFTQPIQSVAHFFVSLATVSYQAAIHPANECQYALGYYRPGNCAPWLKDPIPISLDGARRQALVTTGLAFIP